MTEDEVVRMLHEYFETLFPKVCPRCGLCFTTLRQYIRTTKRLSPVISYDAEMGKWDTATPIGSMALTVCPCGTTLALSTVNMELSLRLELLNWIRVETELRGVTPSELMERIRDRVRERVDQQGEED